MYKAIGKRVNGQLWWLIFNGNEITLVDSITLSKMGEEVLRHAR